MTGNDMVRYSVIHNKNPREIVLLRGNGCKWRKCRFCDYHLDASQDEGANTLLNQAVLNQVTGCYGRLEVTNSGSFTDLNNQTISDILDVCRTRNIGVMHIECHWMHRDEVAGFRAKFRNHGVDVRFKIGVETFDVEMREQYMRKGMGAAGPQEIAAYFNEICLLQGVEGQDRASMCQDIETGLKWFDRVCVNLMQDNGMPVRPSKEAARIFREEVYPRYIDNDRVDILVNNTDFGVGEVISDDE